MSSVTLPAFLIGGWLLAALLLGIVAGHMIHEATEP